MLLAVAAATLGIPAASTTAVRAAAYTYDVPAIERVDAPEVDGSETNPQQVSSALVGAAASLAGAHTLPFADLKLFHSPNKSRQAMASVSSCNNSS